MFELLGISLLLAALLTFNSVASSIIAGLWRVSGRTANNFSAAARARLLFVLRTLPPALSVLCVALLLTPSYLEYEPRHAAETVSFKLGFLAAVSATGLAVSLIRSLATYRATVILRNNWLRKGKRIEIPGINVDTYEIDHPFPLVGIVGSLHPRLFVAKQVRTSLTAEEIAAAIAHENGHLAARDNLKRGILQACRDALLIIPSGRLLDRAWADASEEAADECAAEKGNGVALDLASALVKIARMIPPGGRPTMPAGVFLLGEENEAKGVKSRVRRLLDLAATEHQAASRGRAPAKVLVWGAGTLMLAAFIAASTNSFLLARVHFLIEHIVFALR